MRLNKLAAYYKHNPGTESSLRSSREKNRPGFCFDAATNTFVDSCSVSFRRSAGGRRQSTSLHEQLNHDKNSECVRLNPSKVGGMGAVLNSQISWTSPKKLLTASCLPPSHRRVQSHSNQMLKKFSRPNTNRKFIDLEDCETTGAPKKMHNSRGELNIEPLELNLKLVRTKSNPVELAKKGPSLHHSSQRHRITTGTTGTKLQRICLKKTSANSSLKEIPVMISTFKPFAESVSQPSSRKQSVGLRVTSKEGSAEKKEGPFPEATPGTQSLMNLGVVKDRQQLRKTMLSRLVNLPEEFPNTSANSKSHKKCVSLGGPSDLIKRQQQFHIRKKAAPEQSLINPSDSLRQTVS